MARRINAKDAGIRAEGLAELNRALKAIGKEAQGELKQANVEVAKYVGGKAQARAASQGGVAAKVAPSIDGGGGVAWAGVRFGGSAYPMAGGAEFGSIKYAQFKPWRGSGSGAGYFVYPTIRDEGAEIEQRYTESIDDLIRKHGLI